MPRIFLTATIPYVNARPHLGFALEPVQADVLARHHRLRGDEVRLQTGTDDNSLKNVQAADAEGLAVRDLVDRNAALIADRRIHVLGKGVVRFHAVYWPSLSPRAVNRRNASCGGRPTLRVPMTLIAPPPAGVRRRR
ncbi:methionyl-tRNA synthetase [Streptosporangium album]|uniref:Methionyl-tRNA synthetase n=1 Tax=Streptosporangium album TaxID=47479 RepID=A0A7W7WAY0_9ACTN|nr:class I tRNA ligase family protein [Streptosporangium album]MBB4940917.1 methionyl-tRNA synthetase [Streptosporangium album]